MKTICFTIIFLLTVFVTVAQTWAPVGGGMNKTFHSLVVYNGQLCAGGAFTTADSNNSNHIAFWDGTTWSKLGTGIAGSYVSALATNNQELFVGGVFNSAGGISAFDIAKWNGASWYTVGTYGMNGSVNDLTTYNSELYAGGAFTTADGNSAKKIAKWDGTSWSNLGVGLFGGPGDCF